MFPIFLALALIAILFLVFIAGQPDEFKVSPFGENDRAA